MLLTPLQAAQQAPHGASSKAAAVLQGVPAQFWNVVSRPVAWESHTRFCGAQFWIHDPHLFENRAIVSVTIADPPSHPRAQCQARLQ